MGKKGKAAASTSLLGRRGRLSLASTMLLPAPHANHGCHHWLRAPQRRSTLPSQGSTAQLATACRESGRDTNETEWEGDRAVRERGRATGRRPWRR
jgi:hypothetical protein